MYGVYACLNLHPRDPTPFLLSLFSGMARILRTVLHLLIQSLQQPSALMVFLSPTHVVIGLSSWLPYSEVLDS